jgi:hypothetical protein
LFITIRDFYHTVPFAVDTGKVSKRWNKHMPVVIGQSLQRVENPSTCSQLLEVSPNITQQWFLVVPSFSSILGDKIIVLIL